MSGRADSDTHPEISEADAVQAAAVRDDADDTEDAEDRAGDEVENDGEGGREDDGEDDDESDAEDEEEDPAQVARRARWTASGAGALLTLAGLAAALLRLTGPAPALVPAAYAIGAAVCALAAFLGSRGRTRRALWLLIAGVMVMALGDQFD
ncbi:hypothetical protein [Streptomyces kebangsaanensis]|uniref:hypothetical protein n=1 Tax=Streptomyces kebangsaanensis TaxID=864058 RepID=UPI00093E429B|nr:hypothetical protein [Streptomyces kebangsaanensis]